jgi:superfamily II DNA/RNA helicase
LLPWLQWRALNHDADGERFARLDSDQKHWWLPQGSGKTLAFAIPIVQSLLHERVRLLRRDSSDQGGGEQSAGPLDFGDPQDRAAMAALTSTDSGPLRALVLCPTRELAMQVSGTSMYAVSVYRGQHQKCLGAS